MTSTEILSVIRKLLDCWVDFQMGGHFGLAATIFGVVERSFTLFRRVLINERRAKEDLPPLP